MCPANDIAIVDEKVQATFGIPIKKKMNIKFIIIFIIAESSMKR